MLTLVTGALVATLLLAVATSEPVPLAERNPSMPFDLPTLGSDVTIETIAPEPGDSLFGGDSADVSQQLRGYLLNIFLFGALALALWGLAKAWQHRPELIWRRVAPHDDFVKLEAVAAAIAADAAAQRAALDHGEARNAIVDCWSRLEKLVTLAGFDRDPADTPAEFTARILSRYPIDPAAIADLSSLYSEARFSTHAMGEPERADAIRALGAIHTELNVPKRRAGAT